MATRSATPEERRLSRKNIHASCFLVRDVERRIAHSLFLPSNPINRLLTDPIKVRAIPMIIEK